MVLYKKDSSNKIRIIKIWTENNKVIQEVGIKNGKMIRHEKTCKPRNINKSNATTGEQQAKLDMESKIREKLQEDYFRTKEEAMNSNVLLPMLAKNYNDEKKKIDWSNCYIQPKLDGQRVLAICTKEGGVTLLSRDGVDIQKAHGSMQHIINDLSTIKQDVILDGEAYCHSEEDNFQDIMKAIKKYRPGVSELIKFHVYDMVSTNGFKERTVREYIKGLSSCKEVSTYEVLNEDMMIKYHEIFLKDGYEGSIIRHGNEGYKLNGRSSNLLKYKDFQDNDYLIIDVIPAENRPEWGMIVCQSAVGTFNATPKMSHEKKKEILLNKKEYIGKTAVIKHFGFTDKGLPRIAIYKGYRLDNLIK